MKLKYEKGTEVAISGLYSMLSSNIEIPEGFEVKKLVVDDKSYDPAGSDVITVDSDKYVNLSCERQITPLSFRAAGNVNSYMKIVASGNAPHLCVQYSFDNETWQDYAVGQEIIIAKGRIVYFRAGCLGNSTFAYGPTGYNFFQMWNGTVKADGDIMSLLDCEMAVRELDRDYCFFGLFEGCATLVSAPRLTARKLSRHCYQRMFAGCGNLAKAPKLPITDLKDHCYAEMFASCVSLENAPELPAEKLAPYCYYNMFSGCNRLKSMNVGFTKWNHDQHSTKGWLSTTDVGAEGRTFRHFRSLPTNRSDAEIPDGWATEEKKDYLSFTAWEDNSSITLTTYNSRTDAIHHNPLSFEFSSDGINWYHYWTFNSEGQLVRGKKIYLANFGDTVYFRNESDTPANWLSFYSGSTRGSYRFEMEGNVAAGGNAMSLLDKDVLINSVSGGDTRYALFNRLFDQCTALVKPPKLPLKILPQINAYREMFFGCTSLQDMPELPAEIISENCYRDMFNGCASLTGTADRLPAETLKNECYYTMFSGCSSLTAAPALPATALADSCYRGMFSGCSSLTAAPALNSTNIPRWCYQDMFSGCVALELAPDLPATRTNNPSQNGYNTMFKGCKSMVTGPKISLESDGALAGDFRTTTNMFQDCTSLSSIAIDAPTYSSGVFNPNMFANVTTYGGVVYCRQSFIDSLSGAAPDFLPATWSLSAFD